MVRHQHITTQTVKEDDVRIISIECLNCGYQQEIDASMNFDARGVYQCDNCDFWFEYQESYEEVPE